MPNVPDVWLGGYSLKVTRNCPTWRRSESASTACRPATAHTSSTGPGSAPTDQELLLHIGIAGAGEQGRHPVFAGEDFVDDRAGLDRAGPPRQHGHAEAALEGRALLAPERVIPAIRPGEDLGAIVAREDHDGVVGNAEIVQVLSSSPTSQSSSIMASA